MPFKFSPGHCGEDCNCGADDVPGCDCDDGVPRTLHATFSGPGKADVEVVLTWSDGCFWESACYDGTGLSGVASFRMFYSAGLVGATPNGTVSLVFYAEGCPEPEVGSCGISTILSGSCSPFSIVFDAGNCLQLFAEGYTLLAITG